MNGGLITTGPDFVDVVIAKPEIILILRAGRPRRAWRRGGCD